ncbi:hypothetical protein ACJMK2_043778 [Sinanodonta woodiana]|uniref:Ig-like domain-containing protein n=1 Tax=Sinanodonta woodiana TaxID=1069815 RepID=A0ABD3VY02_SINWO
MQCRVVLLWFLQLYNNDNLYLFANSHKVIQLQHNYAISCYSCIECNLKNENVKSTNVIWRREPSDHPLTIGKLTYIDDDRYQVNHVTDKPEWNLLIKNVSPEDSGKYECQVAAKDRTLRKQIYLHVRGEHSQDNPSIIITGTLHVDKGQPINLACNATGATTPPDHIDWFKDGIKVTTDSRRKIDIHKRYSLNTRTITSNLTIKHSDMPDTGTYVCRTSDLQVTSVKVNILNAEKTSYKREPLSSSAGKTNGKTNNLTDTRNSVQSIFQNTIWITVLLTLLFSVHDFSGTVMGRFEPK